MKAWWTSKGNELRRPLSLIGAPLNDSEWSRTYEPR